MQSLNVLLLKLKDALIADEGLGAWAQDLKVDEPGTSGVCTVRLGNEYLMSTVPSSMYPYIFIVVGNETDIVIDAMGEMITRQIFLQTGFFDNNVERGTLRAVTLEETLVRAVDRTLGALWIAEDNPDGLIYSHGVGRILTDGDANRPEILRVIPVEVSYTLSSE